MSRSVYLYVDVLLGKDEYHSKNQTHIFDCVTESVCFYALRLPCRGNNLLCISQVNFHKNMLSQCICVFVYYVN